MKKSKTVFICVLAGIISCSGGLTASAGRTVNSGSLKNGLLLNTSGSYQYNINDYDTNGNNEVNVLDLCRSKRDALENNKRQIQNLKISCSRPWTTDDNSMITIPVNIKGSTTGLSALTFSVNYDRERFVLENVYSYLGNVSFSKSDNFVQFASADGTNITREGDMIYLVFSVAAEVPHARYDFYLSGIEGTAQNDDGSQREMSYEECPEYSNVLSFSFSATQNRPETTVTVPDTAVVTTEETTVTTTVTTEETTVSETTAKPEPQRPDRDERMTFLMNSGELSADGSRLRIPVYMDGNTSEFFSVSMKVKYDSNKFSLAGVSQGSYPGYGYVAGNKDNAVFNTFNNQNISDRSGTVAYLEFDVSGGAGYGEYRFELTEIKAYYSENWSQKELQRDKYNDRSEVYSYSFANEIATTTETPWTPPETTTTESPWTTPPETTTTESPWTTPVTTTTEAPWTTPPETTTTEAPWTPPETTTTEAPWTPPETTPEEPFQGFECLEQVEIEIGNIINQERNSKGMSSLRFSEIMCQVADIKAENLVTNFNIDSTEVGRMLRERGETVSANSCVGTALYATASEVVKMVNQGKVSDFDSPDYTKIGVGHYYNASTQYKHYWVVIVGR